MARKKDILHHDGKTKEDLLANVEVQKTTKEDIEEIIRIIAYTFEVENGEEIPHQAYALVEHELYQSRIDVNESVKLVDKRDGRIYGLIIYSHFPIDKGSPILEDLNSQPIGEYLKDFTQINGFAFIIDSRLRGTGVDKNMIMFNYKWLETFDFIWAATAIGDKTNNYWQKWGGIELMTTDEAVFYIKNMAKKNMDDVFILKLLAEKAKKDEKNPTYKEPRAFPF